MMTYDQLKEEFLRINTSTSGPRTAMSLDFMDQSPDLLVHLENDEFVLGMLTAIRSMVMACGEVLYRIQTADGDKAMVVVDGEIVDAAVSFAQAAIHKHELTLVVDPGTLPAAEDGES